MSYRKDQRCYIDLQGRKRIKSNMANCTFDPAQIHCLEGLFKNTKHIVSCPENYHVVEPRQYAILTVEQKPVIKILCEANDVEARKAGIISRGAKPSADCGRVFFKDVEATKQIIELLDSLTPTKVYATRVDGVVEVHGEFSLGGGTSTADFRLEKIESSFRLKFKNLSIEQINRMLNEKVGSAHKRGIRPL